MMASQAIARKCVLLKFVAVYNEVVSSTDFVHFSTPFVYSIYLVVFSKWWSRCSWRSQETAEEKVPPVGKPRIKNNDSPGRGSS